MEEIYKKLAERNGWSYSVSDGRPYFMKNGDYAIPDESTSEEDKDLLATIISEGSMEMKTLVLTCWNNNIKIGGPCSGILEFHKKNPVCLHFAMMAQQDIILPLSERLKKDYPGYNVLYRKGEERDRVDVNYSMGDRAITTIYADYIFKSIRKELEGVLQEQKDSVSHK